MRLKMEQQIRRRFSHLLTSSIGMCRSKQAAESLEPVSVPNRTRKARLVDLFSADSDTISSTTRCEKFDSDKTWSGSEADRASMSHLSPFEYETCDAEFGERPKAVRRSDGEVHMKREDETTAFRSTSAPDYYRKSCSSKQKQQQRRISDPRPERGSSSNPRSDSDIASSLLMELSQNISESEKNVTNNAATKRSTKSRRRRRRRRRRESEVAVEGGSMAVAKSSVDPYGDFRRSMVEMIVEKEIFGKEELEELLTSFLSLNSPDHHKIIVFVFVEILEIVFSSK